MRPIVLVFISLLVSAASAFGQGDDPPAGLRVAVYSATTVGLAWSRGATEIVAYEVRRDGETLATREDPTYVDATLEGGRDYRYEVAAIDAAGRRSAPASILVRTAPARLEALAPPANLQVSRYSDTALAISWARSPIPGLRYRVSRDFRLAALTDGTSHVDRDLVATSSYAYAVQAIAPDGRRSAPARVIARPSGPPPMPTGLHARIYSSTAVEVFWRGGKTFLTEIRRDGLPITGPVYGNSFTDVGVSTSVPRYEVLFVGNDGARSAPATLSVDMAMPEREVGALGAGPDPVPRPPDSVTSFAPTSAPPASFGADVTAVRLFGDIDVRLEGAMLLWDRVPNAARYRIEGTGGERDIDTEQLWTTFYLGGSLATRYTVTALDMSGAALARTAFLVEGGFSPSLFPLDDDLGGASANRFALPDPSGQTVLERLGFDATRELADELLSGSYLELYFEVDDALGALIADVVRRHFENPGRLAGNLAAGDLPVDVPCPDGGRVTVESLETIYGDTLRSRLSFAACALADRTLSGRVSREAYPFTLEPDARVDRDGTTTRRLELDRFGVDAGARRFEASGTAELFTTAAPGVETCAENNGDVRELEQELVHSVYERDSVRHDIVQSFHLRLTSTRGQFDADGTCREIGIIRQDGRATVRSPRFGAGSASLWRAVESSDFVLGVLPAGQFKADFGDGSRFAISYFGMGDEARVDLLSGDDVVSFRDTVPF